MSTIAPRRRRRPARQRDEEFRRYGSRNERQLHCAVRFRRRSAVSENRPGFARRPQASRALLAKNVSEREVAVRRTSVCARLRHRDRGRPVRFPAAASPANEKNGPALSLHPSERRQARGEESRFVTCAAMDAVSVLDPRLPLRERAPRPRFPIVFVLSGSRSAPSDRGENGSRPNCRMRTFSASHCRCVTTIRVASAATPGERSGTLPNPQHDQRAEGERVAAASATAPDTHHAGRAVARSPRHPTPALRCRAGWRRRPPGCRDAAPQSPSAGRGVQRVAAQPTENTPP